MMQLCEELEEFAKDLRYAKDMPEKFRKKASLIEEVIDMILAESFDFPIDDDLLDEINELKKKISKIQDICAY